MNVSAIIVTRGDVDLWPIIKKLPSEWELVVWDNGAEVCTRVVVDRPYEEITVNSLAVYGRYEAIEYASHDLIYVQDDDCIVSDPQAIVDALTNHWGWREYVWCNMPPEFRHDFYVDHALVGFGAAFHRDAPARAFGKFYESFAEGNVLVNGWKTVEWVEQNKEFFRRTCDIVFTGLTPRVLVDVPVESLPYAHDDNRMWRQPTHQGERAAMLELVRKAQKGAP